MAARQWTGWWKCTSLPSLSWLKQHMLYRLVTSLLNGSLINSYPVEGSQSPFRLPPSFTLMPQHEKESLRKTFYSWWLWTWGVPYNKIDVMGKCSQQTLFWLFAARCSIICYLMSVVVNFCLPMICGTTIITKSINLQGVMTCKALICGLISDVNNHCCLQISLPFHM